MKYTFLVCFVLIQFAVIGQKVFTEEIFDDNIKTDLLYPYSSSINFEKRSLAPPVINLKGNEELILEFDDLTAQYKQFVAKVISCDINWNMSILSEMEYIDGFNDFVINTYEVSQNTKVPYYHYRLKLPRVRQSGNYVIQVYEGSIGNKLVLQKRFQVYASLVNSISQIVTPQDINIWRTHHQINISVDISNYLINFPQRELEVLVRQNFRNDKVIKLDSKLLVPSGRNTYTFKFFDNENTFEAGNEFRFCDLTSAFSKGNNVAKTFQGSVDKVETAPQNSRTKLNYLNAYDNNGGFIVRNLDGQDMDVSSDYMKVKFVLNQNRLSESETPIVLGKFNNWNTEKGKMVFNPNTENYEAEILLKQGLFDFMFVLKDNITNKVNDAKYEGNFSETSNNYEVFIYQKSPNQRVHNLIGYQVISNIKAE